ncbi:hypothetical protein LTR78_007857 [Recurvomyces mirabilis]|uniref:Uncharacterized protein n=1 Tax=Recurvomyces mirabilis TaxID=574656 RepID=A0AAE0WH87_9PEZI|nr:hypothetical protein LTR78_007857 [Recurvomyces mirabilis]KAK5160102.1 hypothetical protein LTS14_002209 [Recurvomyces mirabilis]
MHDIDMLCKSYRTGWDLEITSDFLDMVMDRLVEYVTTDGLLSDGNITDDTNSGDVYHLLLDTFAVGSPGRRFIVDWLLHSELDQDEATDRILDFMKQDRVLSRKIFFERCLSRRPERAPWETDFCAYHLHLDNEPTCHERRAQVQGQTQLLEDEG